MLTKPGWAQGGVRCLASLLLVIHCDAQYFSTHSDLINVAAKSNGCNAHALSFDGNQSSGSHPIEHAIDDDMATGWSPIFPEEFALGEEDPDDVRALRSPGAALLFSGMHTVSVIQVISGLGGSRPLSHVSFFHSTRDTERIQESLRIGNTDNGEWS